MDDASVITCLRRAWPPDRSLAELLPEGENKPTNAGQIHQLLVKAMDRAPGQLRWNLMTQEVEFNGQPFTEAQQTSIYIRFQERGYVVSKQAALDALALAAQSDAYHPVRDYLEACRLTPAEDISRLASKFLRREDLKGQQTVFDRMLMKTLVGGVKRVYEPGCQHDTCLVLKGPQGCRKTSFWRTLFSPWFSTFRGRIGDKDALLQINANWGLEMGELDGITSHHHAGHLKNFVSTPVDHFRTPYGSKSVGVPRPSIFCGTCNAGDFLTDTTGARRWWIVSVQATQSQPIDISELERHKDGIWAAALKLYEDGYSTYLDTADECASSRNNDDFDSFNPIEDAINEYLRARPTVNHIYPLELREHLLKTFHSAQKLSDHKLTQFINMGMIRSHWTLKRAPADKFGKNRPRLWFRDQLSMDSPRE